jgi:hypothetical protein
MVGLGVTAAEICLSALGLNLAPLLAGLGVIGIALGFGAQSLVRDIISGIFFLMEDAFRVGEYIDTGRLRGTVEGMSLRSVRPAAPERAGAYNSVWTSSGSHEFQPRLECCEIQPSS